MFENKTSILDKIMLKSLGYGIIKYINKFLGIIGIDLHFFTYKAIIATVILCSLILIVKFTSIISNLVRKNDFRTEKTAKTIKTIHTDKTNMLKKTKTSSSSNSKFSIKQVNPISAKRVNTSSSTSSTSSISSKTKSLGWTSLSSRSTTKTK